MCCAPGHVEEVCRVGGALNAHVVEVDSDDGELKVLVHYIFPSRAQFDTYAAEHAPRLREEGVRLFGETGKALKFERTLGEMDFQFAV